MPRVFPALVLLGLACAIFALSALDVLPRQPVLAQVLDTSGNEEPLDGALPLNGWNVANYEQIRLKDFYQRHEGFLGEPLSGFDGRTQTFRLGRITYGPGKAAEWQLELENLGFLDMQLEGYTPRLGSSPHPAVRDWLLAQQDVGTDLTRVVGRTISEAICERKSKQCSQWTDKQRFLFRQDALTGDEVQRAPLGLWLSHPRSRPVLVSGEPVERHPNVALILLAAVLAVLAVSLLRGQSGGRIDAPL
jgi:hypothetical protein